MTKVDLKEATGEINIKKISSNEFRFDECDEISKFSPVGRSVKSYNQTRKLLLLLLFSPNISGV